MSEPARLRACRVKSQRARDAGVGVVLAGVGALAACPIAEANINVEFRPSQPFYNVGDVVRVGVYATSDSASNQLLSAAQIIFDWDIAFLQLTGNSGIGAVSLLSSGFPSPDPYGLNEANPPMDGNGLYVAFANFGSPVAATPSGTLLTTLVFSALAETAATPVDILASGGSPLGRTTVFDGTIPNFDVTGTLTGASITIVPAPGAATFGGVVVCTMLGRRRRR
mgnify:CR=1 FL=1